MKLILPFILAAAFGQEAVGVTVFKISGSPSQTSNLTDWTATKKQPKRIIKEHIMKLLIPFILAAAAFGQDQSKVEITITLPNGTKLVESISGAPAAAGIDTLSQWMATQTECRAVPEVPAEKDANGNVTKPGKPAGQECKPKYDSVADAVRHMIVNQALALAQQFPSKALQADILALRQQMAAIEAKRKALAEAALAQ